MSDPRVVAIPCADNGEELVELGRDGVIDVTWARRAHGREGCMVRSGVAERLHEAARFLPPGLRLALAEGYRSPHGQARIYAAYRADLAHRWPTLSNSELDALVTRHVADPAVNAPHSTGAAFDLTLIAKDGSEVDMGTALDATPEDSGMRCYTNHPDVSPLAQLNRALLSDALSKTGFINYPTEWWHWSFGDRYWAFSCQKDVALYESV